MTAQELIELGSIMRDMSDHAENVHDAPCIAIGIAELFTAFVTILRDANVIDDAVIVEVIEWLALELGYENGTGPLDD